MLIELRDQHAADYCFRNPVEIKRDLEGYYINITLEEYQEYNRNYPKDGKSILEKFQNFLKKLSSPNLEKDKEQLEQVEKNIRQLELQISDNYLEGIQKYYDFRKLQYHKPSSIRELATLLVEGLIELFVERSDKYSSRFYHSIRDSRGGQPFAWVVFATSAATNLNQIEPFF